MGKVIAIANQKGGVAKTTTTAAMSSILCENGKRRVLAVDLDPQSNLSYSSSANIYEYMTIYDVLKGNCSIDDAIQKFPHYDIVPSNISLAGAEQELNTIGKEFRLREALAKEKDNYDYILLDTPPSLGILTVNALSAADDIIVPSNAGIYAATGMNQLHNIIKSVQTYYNPAVKVAGVLITRYNPQTTVGKSMLELTRQLAEQMETKLFNTFIRVSISVEESQVLKLDLLDYAADSTVSEDYRNFVKEYLGEKV